MNSKKKHPKNYYHVCMLEYQKRLIEKHYTFLKCEIDSERKKLICTGQIMLNEHCDNYKVKITYIYGKEPHCQIVEPFNINPCKEIHMYEDHSLCLSYPPDMKWTAWTEVYKYTIPWLVEWVLYYEIFLVNGGKWEGPESPTHFKELERNKCESED